MVKVRILRSAYGNNNGRILDVTVNTVGDYVYGSGINQLLILKQDAEVVEDVSCDTCKFKKVDLCGSLGACDEYSKWQPIENKSCRTCKYCHEDECLLTSECDNFSGWVSKPTHATGTTEEAKHYQVAEVQPITIMQQYMTKEMFQGFLYGNLLKYALRYRFKGKEDEDLGKCSQYLKWLQQSRNGEEIIPGK